MVKKWNRSRSLLLVLTAVISVFLVMTVKVYPAAVDKWNFLEHSLRFGFREDWKLWLAGILAAGLIVGLALALVSKISVVREEEYDAAVQKKIFRFSFLLNVAAWGFVFLLLFPGAAMNDTIYCMRSPINAAQAQPLVFALVLYGWMHLVGGLTHSMAAYAGLTFLQLVFCAWTAAYGAAWLYGKKIKASVCYAVAVVFAFSPVAADYSVTLVKDTCFAFFFLLLLFQSYDLLVEKNRDMTAGQAVKLAVLMILTALFRSNGKVVAYFMLVVLFLLKKRDRRKLAAVCLAVVCAVRLNGAVVSHYHPQGASFREASGVLTQQMAAVIARDGDISGRETEFLNRVLPIEQWKSCYTFDFVDTLKFNPAFDNTYLNEHKLEYIKTWYSLLRKNFRIYVEAYLFHTYQMWNVASFDRVCLDYTQSVFLSINNNAPGDSTCTGYLESLGLENDSVFPEIFVSALKDTFMKACELHMLLSPGWMVIILILCSFFLLVRKRWMELLFFIPQLMMWLVFMAAAPAGGPFRYQYYLLAALPFSILLAWKGMEA